MADDMAQTPANRHVDDLKTSLVVVSFCSIAMYNFVELNIIIYNTFKRRSGLYFWSFLVSSNGLLPYSLGFLMMDLHLVDSFVVYITLIIVGWVCTVTGQSLVLYSRLHLVMMNHTHLKLVLAMIICNAVICHVPTTVLVYGAYSPHPEKWATPYSIYEKVEVTIFFLQELILSGLYIVHSSDFFRLKSALRGSKTNKLMMHLVWINALIIVLDATILGLEYGGLYQIQTAYKGLVYSVKLKLEFRILNGLIDSTEQSSGNGPYLPHGSSHGRGGGGGGGGISGSRGTGTGTSGTDNDHAAVALDTLHSSSTGTKYDISHGVSNTDRKRHTTIKPINGHTTHIHADAVPDDDGGGRQEMAMAGGMQGSNNDDKDFAHRRQPQGITVTRTTKVESQSRPISGSSSSHAAAAVAGDQSLWSSEEEDGPPSTTKWPKRNSSEVEFAKGPEFGKEGKESS